MLGCKHPYKNPLEQSPRGFDVKVLCFAHIAAAVWYIVVSAAAKKKYKYYNPGAVIGICSAYVAKTTATAVSS